MTKEEKLTKALDKAAEFLGYAALPIVRQEWNPVNAMKLIALSVGSTT